MRDRGLDATESAVTLQSGKGESVLKVLQFGGRDEDGSRNAAISQSDVLVLGGPAG
ncbi:hypothetical protein SBD_1351 [Streptomyces bottropensis ATCC 25435]|jgi:hypothetical protein|uniref:Uncharacterized protein n=1 Tax=Streptomyces bottropensis ATCC 25435 TaxID=1054862 RepID=M3FY85_9ACTN|nr:hypothetical protein SBD_1351 [Streptomyces bottropensis ATCC 25435]